MSDTLEIKTVRDLLLALEPDVENIDSLTELEVLDGIQESRNFNEYSVKGRNLFTNENLRLYRNAAVHHLLADAVSGTLDNTLQGEFHGSGDSGDYDIETGNALADDIMKRYCDMHVKFDWYNNEGGGGDITWDLVNNKITINGYHNVMSTNDVMTEEEF